MFVTLHDHVIWFCGRPSTWRILNDLLNHDLLNFGSAWDQRLCASVLARPSRYIEYGVHPLPDDNAKFKFVKSLVERTVARHRIQLRAPDFACAPALRVIKVAEVSNGRLLQKYHVALDDFDLRECKLTQSFP